MHRRSRSFHYARRIFRAVFTKNLSIKLTALVITMILWLVVTSSRKVEMVKKVPLNFITAPELVVSIDVPREIEVRLIGPSAFIREVMERRDAIDLDLRDKKVGYYPYKLNDNIIKLPIGVKVMGVYPTDIPVKIEPVKTKNVKVIPSFVGDLSEGYKIRSAKIEPSTVQVKGPESVISKMEDVYTEVVDLNQAKKPVNRTVGLDPKYKDKIKNSYDKFSLYVDVVPFVVSQKFYGIKVDVVGTAKYKMNTSKVNVTVQGPKLLMDKVSLKDIKASLDLSFNAPGSTDESVIIKLPEGINLVSVEPKKINVMVER